MSLSPAEITRISIPEITLEWSPWTPWGALIRDARSDPMAARVPDAPGVYEVRLAHEERRLTIGRASNLRMRVKQGLAKGKTAHSAGDRIRANEEMANLFVRWARTDRPSAAEEELHRRHEGTFGTLPKYTETT